MKTITINDKVKYFKCTDINFEVVYKMFQCSDPAIAYGNRLTFRADTKNVEVVGTFSAIIEDT